MCVNRINCKVLQEHTRAWKNSPNHSRRGKPVYLYVLEKLKTIKTAKDLFSYRITAAYRAAVSRIYIGIYVRICLTAGETESIPLSIELRNESVVWSLCKLVKFVSLIVSFLFLYEFSIMLDNYCLIIRRELNEIIFIIEYYIFSPRFEYSDSVLEFLEDHSVIYLFARYVFHYSNIFSFLLDKNCGRWFFFSF